LHGIYLGEKRLIAPAVHQISERHSVSVPWKNKKHGTLTQCRSRTAMALLHLRNKACAIQEKGALCTESASGTA
jgi:hypothetical protein